MKMLRITFITLAILSSIEGFSQDQKNSTTHIIVNPGVNKLSANNQISENNQSVTSTDSTNLAVIAKLPMNTIHFQNKGAARKQIDLHWEDTVVQNESFDLNESRSSKTLITQYKP